MFISTYTTIQKFGFVKTLLLLFYFCLFLIWCYQKIFYERNNVILNFLFVQQSF